MKGFLRLIISVLLILSSFLLYGQQDSVYLKSWKLNDCDKSTDPYHLVNRISDVILNQNSITLFINYKENCCFTLHPGIHFYNDSLLVFHIEDTTGNIDVCGCDCCFTVELEIEGLKDTLFSCIFMGKKISFKKHPYKTYKSSFLMYKNDTINRTNIYGQKIGVWYSFYENGSLKSKADFGQLPLFDYPPPELQESFYLNGQIQYKRNQDSILEWYESGIQSRARYIILFNNLLSEQNLIYYEDGKLKKRTIFECEDSNSSTKKSYLFCSEKVLEEVFFETGLIKERITPDSTTYWNENGELSSQTKTWTEIDETNNTIVYTVTDQYNNGRLMVKTCAKETQHKNGKKTEARFTWKWNANGQLIEKPKKWRGKIPDKP